MGRRPVRRRRGPLRRALPRHGGTPLFVLLAATAILALLAVDWLLHHLLVLLALLAVAGTVTMLRLRARALAAQRQEAARIAELNHLGPFLTMTPKDFEHALALLCRRDGCTDVRVVGGAGDLAADVLATTPTGQRILIQAKRYGPKTQVNSPDVQKVNGTYRDVHGCDLALVVTTGTFTRAAAEFCTRVGIRTVDRHTLAHWAEGRTAPPWV
ncbi:restriction endonuclease [Kitasatospora sp. NPDC088134]|uniref:restriction endonuclease n=1 Tax=Kitasatospora sp. NPDC088134 TaxID=3364071 RepID=UPI00381D2F87